MTSKLEEKLENLANSSTTSLTALSDWLKSYNLYSTDMKGFESSLDQFIDELHDSLEDGNAGDSGLRDDFGDIDDIFNDDFDITRQLDNLYDKIEEEKGHQKADEHIETLNNEYSALKSQFLAHLVELKEFMLTITEDLN